MKIFNEFFKMYGESEVGGSRSNKKILDLIQKYLPATKDDGEVSWCGMFMKHLFEAIKLGDKAPKKFMSAKSWAHIGTPITLSQAKAGSTVVVFHRGDPSDWRGHVGLYVNHNDMVVWVAGGNQSNSVSIATYPASRLYKVVDISGLLDSVDNIL